MQLPDTELFEAVKARLLSQAEAGGRIETETELAEHFGVTRYRVRKELDVLSQMGTSSASPKTASKCLR